MDFAKLLNDKHNEDHHKEQEVAVVQQNSVKVENKKANPKEVQEQKSKGSVGGYVYSAYFKAGGNYFVITTMFTLFVLTQCASSGADYFTSYWYKRKLLNHHIF